MGVSFKPHRFFTKPFWRSFFENSTRFFSKKLVGKIDLKWSLKNASRVSTLSFIKKFEVSKNFEIPWFFQETGLKKFLWKLHKVYFQRNFLEKIDLKWSLKNASRVSTISFIEKSEVSKNFEIPWFFQETGLKKLLWKLHKVYFQRNFWEKIDLKWSLKNASRVSTIKSIIEKSEVFKEPRIFQETASKKFFWKIHQVFFKKTCWKKSI